MALNLEDWNCPVCYELLYKPCVNVCGHIFCFWCMHQAMDPFKPSRCPLCRSSYTHFPKVCEMLHFMLMDSFPAEYRAREVETKEREAEWGLESAPVPQLQPAATAAAPPPPAAGKVEPTALLQLPRSRANASMAGFTEQQEAAADVANRATPSQAPQLVQSSLPWTGGVEQPSTGTDAAAAAAAAPTAAPAGTTTTAAAASAEASAPVAAVGLAESRFCCANPSCGKLLYEPTVLSCGHAVCSRTCKPSSQSGLATPQTTSPTAVTPAAAAAAATAGWGAAGANSSPVPRTFTSAADAIADAVAGALSVEQSAPSLPSRPVCPACHAKVVRHSALCLQLHELLQRLFPKQQQLRALEVLLPSGDEDTGEGTSPVDPSPEAQRIPPWRLSEVLHRSNSSGANWQALRAELAQHADSMYTWHMVGCDDCGVYPIQGRRYTCQDCPEVVGYDLCGACYDSGLAGRGRFNQAHTTAHRLRKMAPSLEFTDLSNPSHLSGLINLLQAVHPELTVEAIFQLAALQFAPDNDPDSDEGQAEPEPPTQAVERAVDGATRDGGRAGVGSTPVTVGAGDHEEGTVTAAAGVPPGRSGSQRSADGRWGSSTGLRSGSSSSSGQGEAAGEGSTEASESPPHVVPAGCTLQ